METQQEVQKNAPNIDILDLRENLDVSMNIDIHNYK
jgi:hypothetical protein